MTQNEQSREALEHLARKELEQQAEKPVYVERSKGIRIFAWVLTVIMVVGVLLYFAWIAGILH